MGETFRLAVGQVPSELDGATARLDWLRATLAQAHREGAQMLLLPELFATGYNIGADIPLRAEAGDGPVAQKISDMAAEFGIAVHYGYAELDGGEIYNAAQCFGADGQRIGHHRKLLLPPGFETTYFSNGSGISGFTYLGIRFATLICYDAEFPETARMAASNGAQVILVPTALGEQWGWVARTMIPCRGFENGVFLAYANSSGTERGLTFLGESFVGAPDGRILVRAGRDPQVICADLDVSLVAKAQARLPYLEDATKIVL